jgi:hypothetical protein
MHFALHPKQQNTYEVSYFSKTYDKMSLLGHRKNGAIIVPTSFQVVINESFQGNKKYSKEWLPTTQCSYYFRKNQLNGSKVAKGAHRGPRVHARTNTQTHRHGDFISLLFP